MTSLDAQTEARVRIGVALLLVILMAAGFWLRVRNLGNLGLVVDEGNQVMAVQPRPNCSV
jgi:hypothetical protein